MNKHNFAFCMAVVFLLSACATSQSKPGTVFDSISGEIKQANAAPRNSTGRPEAVDKALLQPLQVELPKAAAAEPRFDLVVNNAPANQVFMALVSGTRYSMLVHPEVAGTITVNLKDVTVREALDTIRELYGYEYKVQGTRIFIQPLVLQSRIFQINYLAGKRQGQTDTRVTSGSISNAQSNNTNTNNSATGATSTPNQGGAGSSQRANDSSRIYTTSDTDFWGDLGNSLRAIIGAEGGRQVILNPMSGVIVVRAFPSELRAIENFLRATQVVVERQVMIEAKIIEVKLNDGYQSGINWSLFGRGNNSAGNLGILGPGTSLQSGVPGSRPMVPGTLSVGTGDSTINTLPGRDVLGGDGLVAGIFGLAFQTRNFAALLSFLDTQGNVQVLSSPRIASINNQKAVLKVGTDDFFVTSVTTNSTTSTTGTTNSPTITVQPFFSGIALDITPQIDDDNNIILHVHPSVSVVTEKNKVLNLGSLGTFNLPLASSNVNESDSIVRVQDGNIVAIGGLMSQQQADDRSGLPGTNGIPVVDTLFGQRNKSYSKRELVILLKPTIIQNDKSWQGDLADVQGRMPQYDPRLTPTQ